MDDLFNEQPSYNKRQQATLKEIKRRSQDLIRVYNPLDADFYVKWDGVRFKIPNKNSDEGQGKGQQVLPRYLAENYVKNMTDTILTTRVVDAVKAENKRRIDSGMKEMTKYEEEPAFAMQFNISSPQVRGEVIRSLWLGVEQEYGLGDEFVEEVMRERRLSDADIAASLDRPVQQPTAKLNPQPEPPAPLDINDMTSDMEDLE